MNAIQVKEPGGTDKLLYTEVPTPDPGEGQALVKIGASGVNFIDVYFRMGIYKASYPLTLGQEAAGTVIEVGPGVNEVKKGDRVAYASVMGSYAEYAVVPANRLVPVPDSVDDQTAAAVMLQGMTAHYLTTSTFPLKAGDTCLIHAAAGGVGLLFTQMAKLRGARVIGTVSTEEKAALAKEAGVDEIILYSQTDFETETRRLTGGKGVDAVYDSVGKDTFDKSLNCLRPRGYMVLFGASSGPVPPFDPQTLNAKGSLFLTRPTLGNYIATREELLHRAGEIFDWISAGKLKVRTEFNYPLKEAARAHSDLEARKTTGKLLLIP
ncbi:MAG TPA: quinone oxidoreductase [Chloroflexia bacterium]|nr:quinone oxidoreductase [Chloroflexia bacterium]